MPTLCMRIDKNKDLSLKVFIRIASQEYPWLDIQDRFHGRHEEVLHEIKKYFVALKEMGETKPVAADSLLVNDYRLKVKIYDLAQKMGIKMKYELGKPSILSSDNDIEGWNPPLTSNMGLGPKPTSSEY